MPANRILAQEPAAQAGEPQFLTVNMVVPETGDTAEGSAGFGRLLLALSALALERFGAAPEDHCQDALREYVPSCLAGAPVDPFDGQLLRFRKADSGYQLHCIGPDVSDAPSGKGDLASAVVSPQLGSSPGGAQPG